MCIICMLIIKRRDPLVFSILGSAAGTGGLSGGQKRLLMFGVEILSAPAILMLDERACCRTAGIWAGERGRFGALSLWLLFCVNPFYDTMPRSSVLQLMQSCGGPGADIGA